MDQKIEYQDDKDKIEVDRAFGLSKRHHGARLIMEKLVEIQLISIEISVLATNLFKIDKDTNTVFMPDMRLMSRHRLRICRK